MAVIGCRFGEIELQFSRKINERFLDEPRDHARIGAAAGNGGRTAGVLALFSANRFAQRIIGARGIVGIGIEIEAEPWFHHRIDIKRAMLSGVTHQIERSGIDRKIDDERLAFCFFQKGPRTFCNCPW